MESKFDSLRSQKARIRTVTVKHNQTGRVPQELVARTRDERPLPSNFSLNGAR